MNWEKLNELFFSFSEKVVAYIINLVYFLLVASPLILTGLLIKDGIFLYPVLFIPLATLYLIGIKCLVYTAYMIIKKKGKYYKPFFFKSLKENFIKVYLYYLAAVGLLYFGLTSTLVLIGSISDWFWILFTFIVILIIPNIFYSTIQFALYKKKSIKETFKNSVILSIMFGVITVGITILTSFIVYLFSNRMFFVILLIPAYSILFVLVNQVIENNELKKK